MEHILEITDRNKKNIYTEIPLHNHTFPVLIIIANELLPSKKNNNYEIETHMFNKHSISVLRKIVNQF